MNYKPKISVVCPTYNSEKFIIETLKSVLEQTVLPLEIIVSDDGSQDETINKVESFFNSSNTVIDTRLIKNQHQGAGATRNVAICEAKGEWIAFIDSDDLWAKTKISEVISVIKANNNYNFIFHNENHKKLDDSITPFHDFSDFFREDQTLSFQVWKYCIFHTSTITCRKNLLIESGLFNESFLSSQDWELWIRLAPKLKYYHIRKILGTYVDRSNNITNTKSFSGLVDRLKIMTMHWRKSGASVTDYIYMAIRRIIGFIVKANRIKN